MFCKIVSKILRARCPVNLELSLFHTAAYPKETHVAAFGAVWFDGTIDNAAGGVIVSFDLGGRLWMAQFAERLPKGQYGPCIDEQGAEFGL